MEDMKPDEGAIYPAMRISQLGVGLLGIETMAYGSGYPTSHIRFSYEISIRDASKNPSGWGDAIFQGSLKELIDLITRKEATNDTQDIYPAVLAEDYGSGGNSEE